MTGLMASLGIAAACLVALSCSVVVEALYYQGLLGPALQRDLGFREGSASLPSGGLTGYVSAVAILDVAEGGAFACAGFRAGDVLPDESHSSLFKTIHHHRGGVAVLAIVDGGPGPPFSDRPRRVLHVSVPPRRSRAASTTAPSIPTREENGPRESPQS